MAGVGGSLDLGRELAELEQSNPALGRVLRRLQDGVNTLAKNTSSSATGEVKPPPPPDSVSVSVPTVGTLGNLSGLGGGEYMHISISHNAPVQRNIQYFSEIDTNPNFTQPIVVSHGSSRTSHPVLLPTNTATPIQTGPTTYQPVPQTYYVRSYAQYPSSQPSPPTVAGGASSPTPFTLTGGTFMDLAASKGSGTAANTGQQGGAGLGKIQQRLQNLKQ